MPEKYNRMEETLQMINGNFISLPEDEKKRNNEILSSILDAVIENMCEDKLFNYLYRDKYYGGSYYDGLKVGKPDEYDLDLRFDLPADVEPKIEISNTAGFVYVCLENMEVLRKREPAMYSLMKQKLLDQNNFLITAKVSNWMEGVVQKAIDKLPAALLRHNKVEVKYYKTGPAFTLDVESYRNRKAFNFCVDLVPSFVFNQNDWPASPFRENPVLEKPEFLVVPKKPYNKKNNTRKHWPIRPVHQNVATQKPGNFFAPRYFSNTNNRRYSSIYYTPNPPQYFNNWSNSNGGVTWQNRSFYQSSNRDKRRNSNAPRKHNSENIIGRYWRLSFQEQESVLIKDLLNFKPALRLLKKLRDTQDHMKIIASYYLKTVCLWELQDDPDLWNEPLSYVFMVVLKKLQQFLEDGEIPYFWNPENNLLANLKENTVANIANYLHNRIKDIEKHPESVAEFLLNSKELQQFHALMKQQLRAKRA